MILSNHGKWIVLVIFLFPLQVSSRPIETELPPTKLDAVVVPEPSERPWILYSALLVAIAGLTVGNLIVVWALRRTKVSPASSSKTADKLTQTEHLSLNNELAQMTKNLSELSMRVDIASQPQNHLMGKCNATWMMFPGHSWNDSSTERKPLTTSRYA